jgi:hypothetical protein
MPAHSVSINTPTNAKIRQIVQDLEQTYTYTGEPDKFIYGGGKVSEYAQSGNSGSYPPTYMEHVEVGGNIKKTAKAQAKRVINAVGDKAVKSLGGGPKRKMKQVGQFASDFKKGFDQGVSGVVNPITKTLKPVAKLAKTVAPLAPLLLALGEDKMTTKPFKKRVRAVGGGAKARGAIVSKIMKEKGLNLPMASKYVKQHGLY